MTKLYIAVAFGVGMLFMNSLTGEYARYGMEIAQEIDDCERNNNECNYTVTPVHNVTFERQPSSYRVLDEIS